MSASDFTLDNQMCATCLLFQPDKPPIEDLQYFLDFQIACVWAPEQKNLQRKEPVCSSLQFSLMGPKLYISPDQVRYNFIELEILHKQITKEDTL